MKKKELAKRLTRLEWDASRSIVSLETHNSDLLERHDTLTDTVQAALERVKVLEDAVELLRSSLLREAVSRMRKS